MRYLVVAYPELSREDFLKIQRIREKASKLNFQRIEPHFTLVFSFTNIDLDRVISPLQDQLKHFQPFDFVLDKAVSTSDSEGSYVFLVPGSGYEEIQQLHDRLYTGILTPELRADVPFTPHLTVGNGLIELEARTLAARLNEERLAIHGKIGSVDLISIQAETVQTINKFTL